MVHGVLPRRKRIFSHDSLPSIFASYSTAPARHRISGRRIERETIPYIISMFTDSELLEALRNSRPKASFLKKGISQLDTERFLETKSYIRACTYFHTTAGELVWFVTLLAHSIRALGSFCSEFLFHLPQVGIFVYRKHRLQVKDAASAH